MYMNDSDWDVVYKIEDKLRENIIDKEDIEQLIKRIYSLNSQMMHPRLHKKIQKWIDEIPKNLSITKDDE